MKKLLVFILLAAGCATSQPATEPQVKQECVDLTPEYLAEVDKHEQNLKDVQEFLDNERLSLMEYFTVSTGTITDVKFKDKAFVNDYNVALVFAELHQKAERVANLYMLIGRTPDNSWVIVGMFTSGVSPQE